MSGKGDSRRPSQIKIEEWDDNFDKTFKNKGTGEVKGKSFDEDDVFHKD
jgi:hypothetical protein